MAQRIITEVKHKQASPNTVYHCLYAFYWQGQTISQLAKLYGKSISTISNWINKYENQGEVIRQKSLSVVYKKFAAEKRAWLLDLFEKKPILNRKEAQRLFFHKFKQTISVTAIHTILHESGLSWHRLERRAIQIRLSDVLRFAREMNSIPWLPHMLTFLDEVSFDNTDMLRKNGYGYKGQRLIYRGEFSRKTRVSLLCFLGYEGLLDSFMTENTFNRKRFIECCREFALSSTSPVKQYPGFNSVWIMDGACIHTDENLVNYLRSLGIVVIFLPAYCPMYNPIEIVFGLIKQKFRENYIENDKIPLAKRIVHVLNQFNSRPMSKLFIKCGYDGGLFNPSTNMEQNMNDLGFNE